ncbi:neprilysin-4-like [Ischnura elegans]|uniref:neprilysin-4-like n=1 Tax=Ischnura elegans TaxID=197161 RepID=UPI001ED87C49|nr:neprilysin-4-like [Ischnura elegans]
MRLKTWELFYFITAVNIIQCAHIRQRSLTQSDSSYLGRLAKLIVEEEENDIAHILDREVCSTKACKATAKEILKNMNRSADPCDDFYNFACGGWIAGNPVPPTQSHWNQFELINEKLDLQLKEILEEKDCADDPSPVAAAKLAYRSCMDEENIECDGLQPLIDLLREFGGWPMTLANWNDEDFNWQDMVAETTRRLAIAPLIFTYVYLDRKNSSQSVITVDQASFGLPRSMLIEPLTYSKQIEAYRQWLAAAAWEVTKALREPIPSNKSKAVTKSRIAVDSFNLIEFEIELAKISTPSEQRRDPFKLYNPMILRTLQKWTERAEVTQPYARIKWNRFLSNVLKGVASVDPEERIIVREVDYIFRLEALLDRTPLRVIANYIHWKIVKALSTETTKRMRDLAFQFGQILSGVKEDQPRWRDCVHHVGAYFDFATGYQYVQRYFDVDAKKSADNMVEHIREAFKDEVGRLTWMDNETKEAARKKADAMTQFIGYPPWYSNITALEERYKGLSVGKSHFQNVVSTYTFFVKKAFIKLRKPTDRSEWTTSPAVVNAFYNPQKNAITFPAAILQSPFFKKGRIQALNYGSIGVVIGHEITHGFDDMGRQSDLHGNLAQWWSQSTIETYLKKAQCFIDQYGSYRVPELDILLGTEAMANGVITQGENIADNGGIRQAYLAYRRFVQKHGPEPRLQGLEEFTPEQLFFLGFAMVWCESSTTEALLQEVLSDPHSIHRLRVQGTLSNSEDFAEAFHCSSESTMNPKEKCIIW